MDYDLLSETQDDSPILVDALGIRWELDSPYDVDMTLGLGAIGVVNPSAAAAYALARMVQSHLLEAIFYGLLVDETTGENLLG